MMSVPTATCTVSGMPSRCAATARLRRRIRRIASREERRDALTESLAVRRARRDRLVQQRRRSLPPSRSWPGPSASSTSSDVAPDERDLEVVNDAGAVHRQRRDVAALHQIDQHRRHARLDHVRADAPDDARVALLRRDDRVDDAPDVGGAENGGQRIQPGLNERPALNGTREIFRCVPCSCATRGDRSGRRTDRILRIGNGIRHPSADRRLRESSIASP